MNTPRPRLWRVRRGGGPYEWAHWELGLIRVGSFQLTLERWWRDKDYQDPFSWKSGYIE